MLHIQYRPSPSSLTHPSTLTTLTVGLSIVFPIPSYVHLLIIRIAPTSSISVIFHLYFSYPTARSRPHPLIRYPLHITLALPTALAYTTLLYTDHTLYSARHHSGKHYCSHIACSYSALPSLCLSLSYNTAYQFTSHTCTPVLSFSTTGLAGVESLCAM